MNAVTLKRPATLSREVVITTARELAERDGLSGLSMRKLGEALDVSTMAAYRHVASKGAIVGELLQQALVVLDPVPDRAADPVSDVLDAVVVTWTALERIRGLRAELGDMAGCQVTADWATRATAPVSGLVGPGRLGRLQEALVALLVGCSSASSLTWSTQMLLTRAVVR